MSDTEEAKIAIGKDGKLKLKNFYTPFAEAKKEILRRRKDKKLKKRIHDALKRDIPKIFEKSPKSVLARHVLSPHFELLRFLKLSEVIELDALCLEYIHDKFVAGNMDKYHLCKLFFHHNKNKRETDVADTFKCIDFNQAEGEKISKLKTKWGESLTDFHHGLIQHANLSSKIETFDISEHYKRNGGSADKYYAYFFSLFIYHGVLFENYLLNKEQSEFTRKVILTNFIKVSEAFGLKPLVVHLGPAGDEENLYWRYYPYFLKDKINEHIKSKSN